MGNAFPPLSPPATFFAARQSNTPRVFEVISSKTLITLMLVRVADFYSTGQLPQFWQFDCLLRPCGATSFWDSSGGSLFQAAKPAKPPN